MMNQPVRITIGGMMAAFVLGTMMMMFSPLNVLAVEGAGELPGGLSDLSGLVFTEGAVEDGVSVQPLSSPEKEHFTGGIVESYGNNHQSTPSLYQGNPTISGSLIVFNEEIIASIIDNAEAENNSGSSNSGTGTNQSENEQTNTVGDVGVDFNVSAAAAAVNESGPGSVVTFSVSISNVSDSVIVNVGQFNLSLSGSANISGNTVQAN